MSITENSLSLSLRTRTFDIDIDCGVKYTDIRLWSSSERQGRAPSPWIGSVMVLRAVGCLVHGLEYISAAAREALEFTLQTAALRRCTGTTRALYPVFGFRSTVSEVHSPPTIFLDFATVRLANSGTGTRISATTRCAAIMMHMHHDVRSGSLPFRATSVPCVTGGTNSAVWHCRMQVRSGTAPPF